MNRLRQQEPFFKTLAEQPSQVTRRKLLEQATKEQINMMSEVILNLMKRNLPVDPNLYARLKKHREILRQLHLRKNSLKKRRECLMEAKGNKLFHDFYELICVCLNR